MSLAALLEGQQDHLDALLDLLRREQDLLVQGGTDGDALVALAEEKQRQLDAIRELEERRLEAQRDQGYGDDAAGAERAASDDGLLGIWRILRDKTRRAAYLNLLNGSLIKHRLNHNQRVLATLRELTGNPLYGADGYTHRSRGRIQSRA